MMNPSTLLVQIAACIEATFEEQERPPTCFTGVIPGDGATPAWFGGCDGDGPCGMAWVRLAQAYPSVRVGEPDMEPGNCGSMLGLDIEIGVLRCTPVDATDAEEEEVDALASSIEILDDMLALKHAIQCCTSLPAKSMVLGSWTPMGPRDGFVGGAWALYVGV
jgi:hypothetical protein